MVRIGIAWVGSLSPLLVAAGLAAPGPGQSAQITSGPPCGCINTKLLEGGHLFPGLWSDQLLPGDTSDWHPSSTEDEWWFAPSDGQYTYGISVGASRGGVSGDLEVGLSRTVSSNTVYKVTQPEVLTLSGVCVGRFPDCEAQSGCHTSLRARIQVVGRFTATDWSYMYDDHGTHHLAPLEGNNNVVVRAQRFASCDNGNRIVQITYKAKTWWFRWDFLYLRFRCTRCPGAT